MTMNTSWGYKWYDDDWKSTETLIQYLADIASKGGNFLLNVGPTAEGEIPQPSIERLKGIGAWMSVNGEAIYGTTASPFFKLPWGRCTQKATDNGTTLYLHVFDWPSNGQLDVMDLKSDVASVKLLANGNDLQYKMDENGLTITVPETAPDPVNTVLVVETIGELRVDSNMPKQDGGSIVLPAPLAFIHNRGYSMKTGLSDKTANAFVTDWESDRTYLEWMFEATSPGSFEVMAELACEDKSQLNIKVGESEENATIKKTGGMESFKKVSLGTITINEAGRHVIEMRPVRDKWSPINLKNLTLVQK